MSNASLKEQLQAMASQLSESVVKTRDEKPEAKPAGARTGKAAAAARTPQRPAAGKPSQNKPRPTGAPKPKWLELAQYGVALLRSYFPAAFKPMSQVRPLKKGIKEDLVKRLSTLETVVTEDKACMVKSLSFYVNTTAYHRTILEGADRLDLDGQPAGQVTAEEARYSAEKLQAKQSAKAGTPSTTKAAPATEACAVADVSESTLPSKN